MKYDAQFADLQTKLNQSTRILVMLPSTMSVDILASGLALYLSLKQNGKHVSIVTDANLKVAQTNLFGIGDVTDSLPSGGGGNLTLSLEGVVDNDGKVPSLEKLDWFPEGNNLNLVFHVLPGQKFEPINIKTQYEGTDFDLLVCIGASNLQALGNIFSNNTTKLSNTFKVNIDKTNSNNLFGQINIVDPDSASVAEMIMHMIQGLNLPIDADIASNIIAGIYDATVNLSVNTKADTFISLGQAMQMGGRHVVPSPAAAVSGGFDLSQLNNPTAAASQNQAGSAPSVQNPAQNQTQQNSIDLVERHYDNREQAQQLEQALHPNDIQQQAAQQFIQSQFETPTGEYVTSGSPENPSNPAPDWLTPKIFKGGNLG